MNNHRSKRIATTISAAVLSAALILTASTPMTFAAATAPSAQEPSVAQVADKQASDRVHLTSKNVTKSNAQLKTDLDVPVISGMKDTSYQNALNANIAARANAAVDAIAKQAAEAYASRDSSDVFWPFEAAVKFELISDGSAAN
ncbi:PdaC/SigV domain-containing protein [Paenibacillus sp. CF384]|uniref:PdaC/SigV domain-containing protein n=1 Tax=Paenibacillus sp. CF384 TaxID=1884382 RepID=UPI00089D6BBB|nr:DUF4163 domain-containing protein [Paenibacillus sp. CF384]SDW61080.1 protein of unknown function [Paenibacillus sp. CF384]